MLLSFQQHFDDEMPPVATGSPVGVTVMYIHMCTGQANHCTKSDIRAGRGGRQWAISKPITIHYGNLKSTKKHSTFVKSSILYGNYVNFNNKHTYVIRNLREKEAAILG